MLENPSPRLCTHDLPTSLFSGFAAGLHVTLMEPPSSFPVLFPALIALFLL